ncbi:MAG: efflux RND transporter periplasmic adaptor subunit [Terracidiphilus sp.]
MKFFSWFWIGSLVVLVAAGCKPDAPATAGAPETVQAQVVEAQKAETSAVVRTTGTLHAHESATLSAQVMEQVQQVLVREGDVVRAGQTLVILDDSATRASVDQAQAGVKSAEQQQAAAQSNADLAKSTLARFKQLEAQKSVSPQEMDEVTRRAEAANAQVDALKAQVEAARAQLAGARTMLGYTHVIAPFAGVVSGRMVDLGAMAAPGVPLLRVDGTGALELQTMIPESIIAGVHKGMKIGITVGNSYSQRFEGTVVEIDPAADSASHSFSVKIAVPSSPLLRLGMFANAEIPNGTKQSILAPRSAIVMRGSLACVYSLDAGSIAQLRYLTLGNAMGDKVEVLSGLSGGERLLDNPSDRDLAGKRVEVLQ